MENCWLPLLDRLLIEASVSTLLSYLQNPKRSKKEKNVLKHSSIQVMNLFLLSLNFLPFPASSTPMIFATIQRTGKKNELCLFLLFMDHLLNYC